MKVTILGSGGAITTPQPFCQCKVCTKARKKGEPFKRNNSSLFINEINTLIDCGEDIADSINRRNIKKLDNLFITHWHPDHTFGMRTIMEPNLDFMTEKAKKIVNVYIPKKVYETLQKRFPVVDYYFNVQKTGKLHLVEDGTKIKFGEITLTVVGFKGKESDTYAYLIESKGKKVLYAPCGTISFDNYKNFTELDLLINECGVFSPEIDYEISFDNLMKRLIEIKPKKTILTHIEEIEVSRFGEAHLDKMKKQYKNINFDFAFDEHGDKDIMGTVIKKVEINEGMKKLIEGNALGFASIDKKGKPHNIAVALVKVISEDQLLISDNYLKETVSNIKNNPNVALVVWPANWKDNCIGYEFSGKAKYYASSKWTKLIKKIPQNKGEPCKGAIVVSITKIKVLN